MAAEYSCHLVMSVVANYPMSYHCIVQAIHTAQRRAVH